MVPAAEKKSGYLDVKVPAKVRGKGIKGWKAWKKRWVVINGLTNVTTQNPIVTIDMYSHESREGLQLERSTIYLEKVVMIHRTQSKSRPFAFSVEAQDTLVHLSGFSETDSQRWIATLRNILWPSSCKPTLNCGIGNVFCVSIIETSSSLTIDAQIASSIGYMITLPSVILLASLSTGCILVEWPWTIIERVNLDAASHPDDDEKIVIVKIVNDTSSTNIYYFFSEKAVEIYNVLSKRISSSITNNCHSESVKIATTVHPSLHSMQSQKTNLVQKSSRKFSEDLTSMKSYMNAQENINVTKIRSLEDISEALREVELRNSNTRLEEENEEAAVIRRLKKSSTISRFNFSSDDLVSSQHGASPVLSLNRRKSSSDSTLTSIRMSYAEESRRTSMVSDSSKSERSSSEYDDKHCNFQQFNVTTPISYKWQLRRKIFQPLPPTCKHAERPLSVYSSTSQTSRDSGVMLSQSDDPSFQMGHYKNANDKNERDFRMSMLSTKGEDCQVNYRKFSDFIEESNNELLQQDQSQRLSTSSDGTIYSEIDGIPDDKHEIDDPIYEDLDKFRKDIHKLLGIPSSCNQAAQSNNTGQVDHPPPLPPRKYKSRTLSIINGAEVRRKDVMKYLGVDKDKFYGSLDKLHIVGCTSDTNGSAAKRKDIYRFLGIPSMAVSQPAGLNKPELMYDCPPAARRLKNKENEDVTPKRRSSKTYVRIRPRIPSQGSVKEVKNRRLGFLKRKPSSASLCSVEDVANSTYISYKQGINEDLDIIEGAGNENKKDIDLGCCLSNESSSSARMSREESNANVEVLKARTEEFKTLKSSLSSSSDPGPSRIPDLGCPDWEQYSEPASCRNSTCSFQSNVYSNVTDMGQPYYVNMSELELSLNSVAKEGASVLPFGSNQNNLVEVKLDDLNYIRDMNGSPFCTTGITTTIQEEESSDDSSDSDYLDMRGTIRRRGGKRGEDVDSNQYPITRNSDYMSMDFPSTSAKQFSNNTEEEDFKGESVNLTVEENEDNQYQLINCSLVDNTDDCYSNGLCVRTDQNNGDDNLKSCAERTPPNGDANDNCGGEDGDALRGNLSLRITEISHPVEETSKCNRENMHLCDDAAFIENDVECKSHVPYNENDMKSTDENESKESTEVLSSQDSATETDKDSGIITSCSTDSYEPKSTNDLIIDETDVSNDDDGLIIRQRLSSYIDEIFEQSVMEFENQLMKQCGSQKSLKVEAKILNFDPVNNTLELINSNQEKLQPIPESED